MTPPTDPTERGREPPTPILPADPAAYDDERAARARARGLSAPYIAGGRDPNPEAGQTEERRLLRILVAFVMVVVLSGFVLGVIAMLVTGTRV